MRTAGDLGWRLTHEHLYLLGACEEARRVFTYYFPDGLDIRDPALLSEQQGFGFSCLLTDYGSWLEETWALYEFWKDNAPAVIRMAYAEAARAIIPTTYRDSWQGFARQLQQEAHLLAQDWLVPVASVPWAFPPLGMSQGSNVFVFCNRLTVLDQKQGWAFHARLIAAMRPDWQSRLPTTRPERQMPFFRSLQGDEMRYSRIYPWRQPRWAKANFLREGAHA